MKDNKNVIHILVLLIIVFVLNCCGETYKSGERERVREELTSSLQDQFGFTHPNPLKKFKGKNWVLYDKDGYRMSFICDSCVLNNINIQDL